MSDVLVLQADKYWTVEVAFKLSELALNETVDVPPRPGQYWRINFSRVEWHVKAVGDHFIKTNSTCDNVRAAVLVKRVAVAGSRSSHRDIPSAVGVEPNGYRGCSPAGAMGVLAVC